MATSAMTRERIDGAMMPGQPVADAVFADLEPRIAALIERGFTPGLGTILVGERVGERALRRHEEQEGRRARRATRGRRTSVTTRRKRICSMSIRDFNDDPAIDAFLVQHPTPDQIDYEAALGAIDPDKDVDGMHPLNLGRLALSMPGPVPCTPAGIEALLAHYEIPVSGREVCILGRGFTLGRPLALLLSQKRPTANAAVTVVHTGVPNWPDYTRRAEIVIAAAGVPGILQPEHLTPGVGGGGRRRPIRGPHAAARRRRALRGGRRAAITPRVGGVGPTTIAMLFKNAIDAAERRAPRLHERASEPRTRSGSDERRGRDAGARRSPARCAGPTWRPASHGAPACGYDLAGVGGTTGAVHARRVLVDRDRASSPSTSLPSRSSSP